MDEPDPLRILMALLLVLSLIGLMALVLRRLAASGKFSGHVSVPGQGRLHVIETRYLDARRRLVLIRRDRTEHLLLLADGRETILESHIPSPPEAPDA